MQDNQIQFKIVLLKRTMGVFYDVRAHIADANDDYTGKKGSTVRKFKKQLTKLLYFHLFYCKCIYQQYFYWTSSYFFLSFLKMILSFLDLQYGD